MYVDGHETRRRRGAKRHLGNTSGCNELIVVAVVYHPRDYCERYNPSKGIIVCDENDA